MKSFLAIVMSLSATAAMACPNLVGTYLCPGQDGDPDELVRVDQKLEGGAHVYTISYPNDPNEAPMVAMADGLPRTTEEDLTSETGEVIGKLVEQTVNVCQGPTLHLKNLSKFEVFGYGTMVMDVDTSVTPNSTGVSTSIRFTQTDFDGTVEKGLEKMDCRKVN